MIQKLSTVVLAILCAAAAASANEIVVLKGGKTLELAKPYVLRGSQAVMTLKDGTVVSVAAADIDAAATRAARRPVRAAAAESVVATTPVEAAKAQKANPKARVKIGDADVGHTLEGAEAETAEAGAEAGEAEPGSAAKVDVVDFDQRPSGNTVAVKGTVRNSGKVTANDVALTVQAMDDTGKVVASTSAAVSAGSLEAGASATFTASLPMAAKAGTLRFTPRWSSPVSAAAPDTSGGAAPSRPASSPAASAAPAAGTPPATAKPAPPPPVEKKEPEYRPQPDWAPPAANAPMSPPDNGAGYIPGAHEETPPPPPPPPPPPQN